METTLYALFFVSLMPIVLSWLGAFFRARQFGHLDNNHPRIQQAEMTGTGARIQGAQMNAWEALAIFTMVNFIAFSSGLDLKLIANISVVFALMRVLHALFYIANFAWLRSGAFLLSMFCCLYIVYLSAAH